PVNLQWWTNAMAPWPLGATRPPTAAAAGNSFGFDIKPPSACRPGLPYPTHRSLIPILPTGYRRWSFRGLRISWRWRSAANPRRLRKLAEDVDGCCRKEFDRTRTSFLSPRPAMAAWHDAPGASDLG